MTTIPAEQPTWDLATWVFLGLIGLAGAIYVGLGLTPSSYGLVLAKLGAPEQGPILGSPRDIRSDEWAVVTPLFQTAVRNGFREVNETSFYREDLRSMFPVPLRNWTLFLRPQLWAFFLTAAPTAYSIYFAFLICASLAGYALLIRELGAQGFVAAAVSVVIFFSGLFQFWGLWSLAGVPWILLILVSRMKWWHKALLYAWLMPATVLAHCYPPFFIDLALVALVLVLAIRRDWFRSPSEIAAVGIGAVATCCVLYAYYGKLIAILANTVYPGHRIAPPGTVPVSLVLSQFFPFLTIVLSGYRHLAGLNLVEGGTIGSFFPVLTLCLTRFRDYWNNRPLRIAVMILLAAATVTTLWQTAPLPPWVGRILLWDTALPERLFYATGILLNIASALLWSNKLITLHPLRILVFFLAGPVAAVVLKLTLFRIALSGISHDVAICFLVMVGCVIACYLGAARRAGVLLTIVAMTNLFEFGRFNPLQPAAPIFNVPETPVFLALRREELSTPGHILLDTRFFGSTLNGMGFRAVVHVLPTPQLEFFRKYFPTMDAERFNSIFNRYAHIELSEDRLPSTPYQDVALLPAEVFAPIRNSRRVSSASGQREACLIPEGGAVDRIIAQGPHLTIMGWAPWKGESAMQGIRVVSPRALRADSLVTVERADIAESMDDYGYVKSGFELQLSTEDGRSARPEEMVFIASGTSRGDVRLGGPGCS